MSELMVNIITKIHQNKPTKTLTHLLQTFSDVAKIVEPLEKYMMAPVYEKVIEQITTESKYRKQEILDAYTDLETESLFPFVKQVLEEEALNIAGTEMKGWNGLKGWLKEKISFTDISKSMRLGTLYAKALDSSVKHLNYNDKNEVMKFVLQNEVLNTILYHEMNSKIFVSTYFPVKENKIVTDLLKRFHQYMIDTINGKSSIGMLKK